MLTSTQNQKIKHVALLQAKAGERRKNGEFVVEGIREISHCLSHGYEVVSLFVCDDIMTQSDDTALLLNKVAKQKVFDVSKEIYEKMAYRGGTEGAIAVFRSQMRTLDDLLLSDNPLVIVLESVEKPGNLGAVLRTADAAKADAVIICDPLTDLYNPNLIRSSIGAIFTVPCVTCTSEECIAYLKKHGIQILTAQLQDSELYYDTDMTLPTAIVMGTESTGLTDLWRKAADRHIRIPMLGSLDSLNVSVSTAILTFEAVRQRNVI